MTDKSGNDLQIVVFSVSEQIFGIDISSVSEIIKMEKITPIPQSAHYVEGVINIRGTVVPVINLHTLFSIQAKDRDENNRVVITESGDLKFGLIVDAVYEVRKVAPDMIKPAPPSISIDQNYLDGIVLQDENLIVLIKLNKLLSGQEFQAIKELDANI